VVLLKASGRVKESSPGVYRHGVADIGAAAARIAALDENVIADRCLPAWTIKKPLESGAWIRRNA